MCELARQLIEENLKIKAPVLDLGNCGLDGTEHELYDPLTQAIHIETLVLSNDWDEFEKNKEVEKFRQNSGFQNRLIQLPTALPKKLKTLILAWVLRIEWKHQDIFFLEGLTELKNLNLSFNLIHDISFLKGLTQLQHLDLRENYIRDISFLKGLKKLRFLELSENFIQDISFLKGLTQLQHLNLRSNQIQDISFLEGLTQLQHLDLSSNQIQDISFLEGLTQLQHLNLSRNQIQDYSFLEGLTQLQHLDLGSNQIQDYSFLECLTQLQHLNLNRNQILNISLDFFYGFPELKRLNLAENPIQNIPKEIYDKRDNALHEVRHYLEDLTKGATQNNEVKVILIGNGSVGKTQIARRLAEKDDFIFDAEHHSTHAISLLQCSIDCVFLPKGLQLNLWDFGGQDLYHATHRLFMQTRALFLLVWDIENENKEHHEWEGRKYKNENLRYWLEYATSFGNGSPVLVIQNKVDTEEKEALGIPEPEQQALKKYFSNVTDFWQVSAKTGYNFEQLEYFIAEVFENNDTLRQELIERKLPEAWVQVRSKVRSEQARENGLKQITVDVFHVWCKETGVEESSSTILKFFHDTGVLYYNSWYFSGNIILDQAWAIEAIYKLLDRQGYYYKILQKRNGTLQYKEISNIWNGNTNDEQKLFINFLLSAELCFETTKNKEWNTPLQDRTFVVPQLLREDKPSYIKEYEDTHSMEYVHEIPYRFLPSVFIHRFIVKAKDFAQVEDLWQSGMYLQYQGQYAVVEADYREKKIIIRCNIAAKELVTAIKEEMEAINQNTSIKALQGGSNFIEEYLRKGLERLRYKDKQATSPHLPMKKKINIFVSYSSKDRELREILVEGLREQLHHRTGFEYKLWADDGIDLGASWQQEIEESLGKSNATLLLVSASFASSRFINAEELPAFFKKKKEEGFLIMPVLLRQYDFKHFEQLSALNFFKTYYPEYGFNKPTERNKLLPFDKLGDNDSTTDEQLNLYYSKLAGFIHTAVENHFGSEN